MLARKSHLRLFLSFVRREFIHILRDRKAILILFGMPVSLILIFGFALTNEVKQVDLLIADYARDNYSMQLVAKISGNRYFKIQEATQQGIVQIEAAFKDGSAKAALIIPAGFTTSLLRSGHVDLQVILDGADPNTSSTIASYLSSTVADFQNGLIENSHLPRKINITSRMLYNPQMKAAHHFVPGVMALVLMLVCVMMTAISIVKEKETGTIEVLLVSPFKPYMMIMSKAFPYLVLSLVNMAVILLLSIFVLDVPVKGSMLLLFAEGTLFIAASLSLGILISVLTSSQEVAMLVSLMGMLIPTILFSGFMFPIENMPVALQYIANAIPAKWFFRIAQDIMVKGSGLPDLWQHTLVLAGMTTFFFILSLKSFKIRLQ